MQSFSGTAPTRRSVAYTPAPYCVPMRLAIEEVEAIAEHERLSLAEALERGEMLLAQPWGDAALRQIVWDNLCAARTRRDEARANELKAVFHRTCARHPSPCDRRVSPVRERHPFIPLRG